MVHSVPDHRQLEQCVWAACLLEAAARKPGNVHPEAPFSDATFAHFMAAARAVAPVLAASRRTGVGPAVLRAVRSARRAAHTNTNLGIVLLLAPMAAVRVGASLRTGLPEVLHGLSARDAQCVYAAIRQARPAGLGRVEQGDVARPPRITLLEAMRLAAERDMVARQYVFGFADVLDFALPRLARDWPGDPSGTGRSNSAGQQVASRRRGMPAWERAIVKLHLDLLARYEDSLIRRKCGARMAAEASARARAVLDAGWPDRPGAARRLQALDRWLRDRGHQRNPGTTADLVAATLFALFRDVPGTLPAQPFLDALVAACAASQGAAPASSGSRK